MSQDSTSVILAAIATLQADLTGQITRLRVDMMARMDRLQHRLDSLDRNPDAWPVAYR